MLLTKTPIELSQVSEGNYQEKNGQVESLSYVAARHLKQVALLELFEHAPLQLDKLRRWNRCHVANVSRDAYFYFNRNFMMKTFF